MTHTSGVADWASLGHLYMESGCTASVNDMSLKDKDCGACSHVYAGWSRSRAPCGNIHTLVSSMAGQIGSGHTETERGRVAGSIFVRAGQVWVWSLPKKFLLEIMELGHCGQ